MSNNIASLQLKITGASKDAQDNVNALNAAINRLVGGIKKSTPAMREATSAGEAMNNTINKLRGSVETLASTSATAAASSKRISDALKDVGRNARSSSSEVRKLADDMQKLSSGGQALERLGGILSVGVTAPVIALGKASVEAAMDMESITRSLTAVTGSAEETAVQLERLRVLGRLPGLTFEQAAKGSSRLQAVGFSAALSEKAIREMGNAISLSGGRADDLDGVVRALGQIEGKGELRAQELNQLAERIPMIRRALKEAFGTSNTEDIQNMNLSVQDFMTKMVAAFEKFPRMARGMRDEVDDARTEVKVAMGVIGDAVWPVIRMFTDKLVPAITGAANWFKNLPKDGRNALIFFTGLAAVAGPAIFSLGLIVRSIRDVTEASRGIATAGRMFLDWLKVKAGLSTAAAAATTVDTGANKVNTASVDDNTRAQGFNTTATKYNDAEMNAAAAARARATGAVGLHTKALDANSAAAGRNNLANSMAVPAAPGSVAKGMAAGGAASGLGAAIGGFATAVASAIALGVAVVAGALVLQNEVGYRMEEAKGLEKVSWSDQFDQIFNFGNGQAPIRRGNAEGQESLEEFRKARAAGNSPAQRMRAAAKAAAEQMVADAAAKVNANKDDLNKALDAEYAAALQHIENNAKRGDPDTADQRARKEVAPLLQKRLAQLVARADEARNTMGNDYKKQAEYWEIVRDIEQIKEKQIDLELDAAKEIEQNRKKVARHQRDNIRQQRNLRSSAMENRLLMARIGAREAGSEEDTGDMRTITESRSLVPELQGLQELVLSEMRALVASGERDFDAQKEYLDLQKEYLDLRLREEDAYKAADKANANLIRRAKENQRKLRDAFLESQQEELEAISDSVAETDRAAAAVIVQMPAIRERQRQLVEDMNSGNLTEVEYFKAKKEYWSNERKAQSLVRSAANEFRDNRKKAYEEMEKASQEQARVNEAKLKLEEAKIKNDPFSDISEGLKNALLNNQRLNSGQRRELFNRNNPWRNPRHRVNQLVDNLLARMTDKARPVAGETELDKINRETELQNMMGENLQSYGQTVGSMNLRLRGGRNPFGAVITQRKLMQQFYQRMQQAIQNGQEAGEVRIMNDPMKKAREFAGDAAMGRPVVMQVLFDPNMSDEEAKKAQWARIYEHFNQVMYGPQPTADGIGLAP